MCGTLPMVVCNANFADRLRQLLKSKGISLITPRRDRLFAR
jgi:hypothetical protein